MSEVPLRRRIPPKPFRDLVEELMGDVEVSYSDAQLLAREMHDAAMEEIYRLARIGETFERLKYCPAGEHPATNYWAGYAAGWNGAQQWVRDNMEDTSATR